MDEYLTGLRGALATVARQRHRRTLDAKIMELALHRGGGATEPGQTMERRIPIRRHLLYPGG
ncbi:MAG: hypothetical protein HDS20_01500 [Bacteroides sp.]|nr:hypothetical protein [Bacteroides sp.]